MSVIITLVMGGDPQGLEQYAQSNAETMQSIMETAKSHGVLAHRFYGSDDGKIMVVDEWPDEQSFQSFFEAAGDRIGPLMQASGVTEEPQPTFWHKLETGDDYGWEG